MASATKLLDLSVIETAPLSVTPYPYLVSANFLRADAVPEIRRTFPKISKVGFLLASDLKPEGAFKALIEELEGPELTAALSKRFGLDLSPFPRLVTVRGISGKSDGRIHCDSASKVLSLLLYLNDGWDHATGALRVLNSADDFEDMAAEIPPTMGTVFAFLRADHSWHGHKPFVGERRVVQVAWLRDRSELERKERTNRWTSLLKTVFARAA